MMCMDACVDGWMNDVYGCLCGWVDEWVWMPVWMGG